MKSKELVMFPVGGGADNDQTFKVESWNPEKTLMEQLEGFSIWQSALDVDAFAGVKQQQFALRNESGDDLMQIDVNSEGYYVVRWLSKATLEKFLDAVENYFVGFDRSHPEIEQGSQSEDSQKTAKIFIVRIFSAFMEPEFYDAERPIIIDDLQESTESDIVKSKGLNGIELLRIDSLIGCFTRETGDDELGFISPINFHESDFMRTQLAECISETQPTIPKAVLKRFLDVSLTRDSQTVSGEN